MAGCDLPGVHNDPCHPCHSGNSLLPKPPFHQIRSSFSILRAAKATRKTRCSNSFFGLKRRQKRWSICNDSYHDQLASGKLPVMWCCTAHEAQQAPYTWWAQLWVASSTVMANKSCSSLADASSLHLEAADVASYMRRERASFATRGKLWKLWTGVTSLQEVMIKYDYIQNMIALIKKRESRIHCFWWFLGCFHVQPSRLPPLVAKRVSGYPLSCNLIYAEGHRCSRRSFLLCTRNLQCTAAVLRTKKSEHQPKNQFFEFGDRSLDWNLTTSDLCIASHELSNSKELYIWQSIGGLKCVLTKWKWLQATYLYQRVSPSRKGMLDSWFICLMIRRRLLPCSNTNRKKGVGCRLIYSATRPEGLFMCLL